MVVSPGIGSAARFLVVPGLRPEGLLHHTVRRNRSLPW